MDIACKEKVQLVGTGIIEMEAVHVDDYDDQPDNRKYWNETFFKLNIARLVQFEKIVYLDADMLVLRNIDELFSYPSMTAAVSGKCANPEWVELNSGLLVLEPNCEIYNGLVSKIEPAIRRKREMGLGFGDQDVFNEFCPEWPTMPDHDCGESYNASVCFLDKMNEVRSIHDLHVLHYVGPHKVWEQSFIQTVKDIYSCVRTNRPLEAKAYILYRYNLITYGIRHTVERKKERLTKLSAERIQSYIAGKLSPYAQRMFDRRCRRRIKNKDFSIICPTCIGGIIYHRLGMQFDSPTINMFFRQKEFIQMLWHLRECMESELVFLNTDYDYPVGQLNCAGGSVTCYFNHCKTEDEARTLWNKRRERIHYDNLYMIVYDRDMDGLTRDDILALADIPCKRLVVLSEHDYSDIPYVKRMHKSNKQRPNEQSYLDHDEWDFMTFEKQFDFVAWLNGEEHF